MTIDQLSPVVATIAIISAMSTTNASLLRFTETGSLRENLALNMGMRHTSREHITTVKAGRNQSFRTQSDRNDAGSKDTK